MHKITRRRAMRILAAAAGLPLLVAGVRATVPGGRFFGWQGEVLGAASELTLWHWDEAMARRTILKVRHEIERYERIFSLYRDDSEIARLNRDGLLARPSPELVAVIDASQRLGTLSGGAFDITVQPLWRVYEAHFWSRSFRRARHRGTRRGCCALTGGLSPHPAGSGAYRASAWHGGHAQRYRAGLHHRPHRRSVA